MSETQPSLFEPDSSPKETSQDRHSQVANYIARNAKPIEQYPDRTSEAAHDQGWGVVDLEGIRRLEQQNSMPPDKEKPRGFPPVVGPIPGESEGEITPAGHEPFIRLSDKEKALGKDGVRMARDALKQSRPDKI